MITRRSLAWRPGSAPRQSLLALLLAALLLASGSLPAQSHSDSRWVTTWATSPSTLAGAEAPITVQDQTLRNIVHTSAGGSALRLRLANYHGERDVRIGAISVALHAEGAAIDAESAMSLTFSGASEFVIARGASVLSDPLAFDVPAMTNLVVSIHVVDDGGFLTAHALSNQNNYISAPGDFTQSESLPVAEETPAWGLLTAIDVISDEGVTAIATVGDSITDGWGSTLSANQRWPNHFARLLHGNDTVPDFAVVNGGISGNRVTTEASPVFGQNLQARFERHVLALSKLSHMVLLEGINDIGMSSRTGRLVTAEAVIAGYRQIIARAHARGIKIIGATLTPYEGAAYYTPEGEVVRQQVNEFIRHGGEFDGVIDFDRAVQDPDNPGRILPRFTEDNLHPNDEGYAVMAGAVDLQLFSD